MHHLFSQVKYIYCKRPLREKNKTKCVHVQPPVNSGFNLSVRQSTKVHSLINILFKSAHSCEKIIKISFP